MLQAKVLVDYKGKFVKGIDGNYTYVMTEEIRRITEDSTENDLDLIDLGNSPNNCLECYHHHGFSDFCGYRIDNGKLCPCKEPSDVIEHFK